MTRAHPRPPGLRALPRRAVVAIGVIDLSAVAVGTALVLACGPAAPHEWTVAGFLLIGSVVHTEAARAVESRRTSRADRPLMEPTAMWTFAGLVLLPPCAVVGLTVVTIGYWWLRNTHRPPPHRWVLYLATVVLATGAAEVVLPDLDRGSLVGVLATPGAVALLVLAAAVRWLVGHGLVVLVVRRCGPGPDGRPRPFATQAECLVGLGGVALGAAVAVLIAVAPWLAPLLVAPLVVLHRSVMVDELAHQAQTDAKTGLLTADAWSRAARDRLARDAGPAAVLMVDLDRFKQVNDRHGHLVGDVVLADVARTLADGVGSAGEVGRFGGEEFVVLLPGATGSAAARIAEHLRERVRARRVRADVPGPDGAVLTDVTVSIGVAGRPGTGDTLDDLLAAADAALYRAKDAGRDRTEVAAPAGQAPVPSSRSSGEPHVVARVPARRTAPGAVVGLPRRGPTTTPPPVRPPARPGVGRTR